VTNELGEPLDEFVDVLLFADSGGWRNPFPISEADVDADGYYELTGLYASTYRIAFFTSGVSEYLTFYHENGRSIQTATDVVLAEDQTLTINATLQKEGRITGQVVGPDGKGLENTQIRLYKPIMAALFLMKPSS